MRQIQKMDKEQERIIIESVRNGNSSLYSKLIDTYGQSLFALIYKMVNSREDAEELTQDTFVKAFFSLKSFRGDSTFSTWLYRIAYNLTISKLRKHDRLILSDKESLFSDIEDDKDDALMQKELCEEDYAKLEWAMEQLSSKERFLIYAFYYQDKSIEELSQITGFSISNVKVKLFRARKKLSNSVRNLKKEL